jgi:glycosyltransferase involved in cell wall biosynthesis
VKIRVKRSYEKVLGSAGSLFYDLSCLREAIRAGPDIILECGYASAAPWYPLLRRRGVKLVTHMDGMEWQREKWGRLNRIVFRQTERLAVRLSDAIVCDHPLVADYYRKNYSVNPELIPFGAAIRRERDDGFPGEPDLASGSYYLLVARMEPENNIRMILEGFLASGVTEPLVIAGDYTNKYGRRIVKNYEGLKGIRFIGGIYDEDALDQLRHHAKAVFHGHSVGGTNPSLLEAMAAGSLILAHDNAFNRWVLGKNAVFFSSSFHIRDLLYGIDELKRSQEKMIRANLERIGADFQWDSVILRYLELFGRLAGREY